MEATGNYILLRQDPRETMVNGIYLPNNIRENAIGEPFSGIIESVGDAVKDYACGEHIVFDDMCRPWVVETDEYDVIVVKDTDVICKLKDEG